MRASLRTIKGEHLALKGIARVLKMEALVLERGGRVDTEILDDIVAYVAEFPMRFHHPKEEGALFSTLSGRSPEADRLIVALTNQHAEETRLVADLQAAVRAYEAHQDNALVEVARRYGRFLEEHIHMEDAELFPLAEQLLPDAAWDAVDAMVARLDNPDGEALEKARFTRLHLRIMDAALPPLGG